MAVPALIVLAGMLGALALADAAPPSLPPETAASTESAAIAQYGRGIGCSKDSSTPNAEECEDPDSGVKGDGDSGGPGGGGGTGGGGPGGDSDSGVKGGSDSGTPAGATSTASSGGSLPFTGQALLALAAVGALLLALGLSSRRLAHRL